MPSPEQIARYQDQQADFRRRLDAANYLTSLQALKMELIKRLSELKGEIEQADMGKELVDPDRYQRLLTARRIVGHQLQQVQTKASTLRRGGVDPYRFLETARQVLPPTTFELVARKAMKP
jgi:hypothetical protein